MLLVAEVDRATESFPAKEIYGLTNQMRRAAVSVPSNIAEGQGRLTHKDFRNFPGHARGSLLEMETQIRIAVILKYLNVGDGDRLLADSAEVGRILNGLITSLED